MTETSTTGRGRFSGFQRANVALLGTALLIALSVARWLDPDSRGHGTHEHLGLPPCSFVLMFGRRCPSCGMTTSWAHLVRCDVVASLKANAGGTLLGVLALASAGWLVASAWRGRWLVWEPNSTAGLWIAAVVLLVTLIDWGFRLWGG